jgi:hypothetical protein
MIYSSFLAKPRRKLLAIYQCFIGQPSWLKCKILHIWAYPGAESPQSVKPETYTACQADSLDKRKAHNFRAGLSSRLCIPKTQQAQ